MNGDDVSPTSVRPPGARSEESDLWAAFQSQGGRAAREALFALYLPFARKQARRHFLDRSGGDIEFADLFQLACAGLLEAIDRFDPERGSPFRAYATRRISGSILDGVAQLSEVRGQISFRNRVRSERARSLADERTDDLSGADAMRALMELAVGLALGFMLEGSGLYSPEETADAHANAYDSLEWKDSVGLILHAVARLPERERDIIRYHYLSGLTFDRIGALLGVTKGRVSQIHKAAIGRLRSQLPRARDFRLER